MNNIQSGLYQQLNSASTLAYNKFTVNDIEKMLGVLTGKDPDRFIEHLNDELCSSYNPKEYELLRFKYKSGFNNPFTPTESYRMDILDLSKYDNTATIHYLNGTNITSKL